MVTLGETLGGLPWNDVDPPSSARGKQGMVSLYSAGFNRYNVQQQAQEMLKTQRRMMPPRPDEFVEKQKQQQYIMNVSHKSEAVIEPTWGPPAAVKPIRGKDGLTRDPMPLSARERRKQKGHDLDAYQAGSDVHMLTRVFGQKSRGSSVAREVARAKAATEKRLRQLMEQQDEPCDYRRRNVLLHEIRECQQRWPPDSRWAGHAPDAIPKTFERLGTLKNEFGDGRTLPSERAEKYFWAGG